VRRQVLHAAITCSRILFSTSSLFAVPLARSDGHWVVSRDAAG
jgi:hypothetical protein